jgi:RimJ/RimL family protein N-acetyltransferase
MKKARWAKMSDDWDADKIFFRKLQESDLPLMDNWLNTPHVRQWWEIDGKRNPEYEVVVRYFIPRIHNQEPVDCFLVLYADIPVAFIESCRMDNFPTQREIFANGESAAGIDTFIGEIELLHKGFGQIYIRKFLKEIVFKIYNVDMCIIDPEPKNRIAIRAYEKAGFQYVKTVWDPVDKVMAYVMTINRESI